MGTTVSDNQTKHRYEIQVDGETAGFIAYRTAGDTGDTLVFVHTETLEGFEGRGLAGQLVRGALDDLRRRGLKVQPVCPYVKAWIPRHPEYADLVA